MYNMVTVVDNNGLTRNKDKHDVMDVLISWMERILSQCIHEIITLYTLNILQVINYTSVKLKKSSSGKNSFIFNYLEYCTTDFTLFFTLLSF